jgi:RNA polymerase sigma-70 factor (ECF subfamily)
MSIGQQSSPVEMPDGASDLRPSLVQYFRRRTRNSQDVEDLVQEVFLRIVNRSSGGGVENLRGYVFQTAASVLSDHFRRRASHCADDHVEFEPDRHAGTEVDAERILESREALGFVAAALHALPQRTRTIFVLRRLDGLSYKDIARQLGISVSAVEKQMVRAVHQLLAARGTS